MIQQNKNPIMPIACKIISINKETDIEWTFRVESPFKANHGQFMQLSIWQDAYILFLSPTFLFSL